jgi:hypothetical protein
MAARPFAYWHSVPLLTALLVVLSVSPASSQPKPEAGQVVGTIELVADGEKRIFEVREGPITEGFATGYSQRPMGEAVALYANLQGSEPGTGAGIKVRFAVRRESGAHLCSPMDNTVEFYPSEEGASRLRLRPDGNPSKTCPPPAEGRGGLSLHLNVSEATLNKEDDRLHVAGTFAGPLGRGDDAIQVSRAAFEARLSRFNRLQ